MQDLCIIGGGPVGSILALASARLGLKVTLIEKKNLHQLQPASPLDFRHLALSQGSQQILQGLELWSHLALYAIPIKHIHVSEKGQWGLTHLSAVEQDMPALGYVIPFHCLQKELSQALMNTPNIRYEINTEGYQAKLKEDGWQLEIGNGSVISAKLLVAADGLDSALRKNHNIQTIEKNYHQMAIVTTLSVSHPKPDVAFERFTKEGLLAVLPAGDNKVGLVWALSTYKARAYSELEDVQFLEKLQDNFGFRLGYLLALGKRQLFPLKLSISEKQVDDRLIFLGSAMLHLHPIAAQSFNLALRDVAWLFDIFKKNLVDIGSESLLAQYALLRKTDQKRIVRFSDGLVMLFSNQFAPLVLLRNLLMAFCDISLSGRVWLAKYGAGRLTQSPSLMKERLS